MGLFVVLEHLLLDLLGTLPEVVQEEEIVVDDRVQEVVEEARDVLFALLPAEPVDRLVQKVDRRVVGDDQEVRPDEEVELLQHPVPVVRGARPQPVEDQEVLVPVDVDLGPLVPGADVLDGQGMELELPLDDLELFFVGGVQVGIEKPPREASCVRQPSIGSSSWEPSGRKRTARGGRRSVGLTRSAHPTSPGSTSRRSATF